MYWYIKYYWIFLLNNNSNIGSIKINYFLIDNTNKILCLFVYLNNLILGLILFKNLSELVIIILNYNIFLIELYLDIKIILILK